ncbi:MAG: hypothetical protein H6599_11445 [Flavobacteriales bacterium]|nr:hypothetical protein [Flavobacteriales bacterium]
MFTPLHSNIVFYLKITLFSLLFLSFSVEALNLTNQVADMVKTDVVDIELEMEEDVDDLILEHSFTSIQILSDYYFVEHQFNKSEKKWVSPMLEVPELPPLRS